MRKKQIIDKIVNDLPMSDILGKMTKEEWYGWFEECWDKAINNKRCFETLPTDEEIYSEGCKYVREIEQPNRQPLITLRRTFKAGATFVKKQLDN